jgi:cytochrome c oxidase subunit 6b
MLLTSVIDCISVCSVPRHMYHQPTGASCFRMPAKRLLGLPLEALGYADAPLEGKTALQLIAVARGKLSYPTPFSLFRSLVVLDIMTSKLSKIFTAEPPELSSEDSTRFDMIKNVRTTPRDERFPSNNQALHCWNRYNEWIVCLQQQKRGDDAEANCKPLRQYAESICPSPWTEQWDEQRDAGSFSGIGNRFDSMKKH